MEVNIFFGGSLIFGISDENEFIGLEDPNEDAEKISEIIKTRLDPIPEFRLRFHNEDGKILVILDIYKGEETPYLLLLLDRKHTLDIRTRFPLNWFLFLYRNHAIDISFQDKYCSSIFFIKTRYASTNTMFSEKSLKRKSKDSLYTALMMQALGDVDVTFAGLTHSTGEVILAGQSIIGLQEGVTTVSSVGIFNIPNYDGAQI